MSQTPELGYQQPRTISDILVVKPVEQLVNGGSNPIDNIVPNQSSTSMSPASVQTGGRGHRGGRRSAKKRGGKSQKKRGGKSQKKRSGKSQKKRSGKSQKKRQ
uniref:Uncharacterized protein n=1 Tax=viral metagenome TaxID=1070528 RepID=A0A6C0K2M3_9ZZZZ